VRACVCVRACACACDEPHTREAVGQCAEDGASDQVDDDERLCGCAQVHMYVLHVCVHMVVRACVVCPSAYVLARARLCVRACMRACVRVCLCVLCARACVCVRVRHYVGPCVRMRVACACGCMAVHMWARTVVG
jgi:hypothetical protein